MVGTRRAGNEGSGSTAMDAGHPPVMADNGRTLTLHLGHDELVIRRKWETASIVNDVLVALWFVIGSVLFFWESTTTTATWFFLVGSLQFLARPVIRLTRRIHLQRIGSDDGGASADF